MNDYLPWIADNELLDAVDALIKSSEKAYSHAEERIQKNVIDPFSSIIIASTLNIKSSEDLNRIQASQSALSGMSNAIGTFHQSVLGSVEGWLNHDTGYDLENPSRKLIAEIKNSRPATRTLKIDVLPEYVAKSIFAATKQPDSSKRKKSVNCHVCSE